MLPRLVGASDAVLIDLRGFSERKAGIAFELTHLINTKPSEKIVSPNRRTPPEPIRPLRLGRQKPSRESRRLLSMLCAAARPA